MSTSDADVGIFETTAPGEVRESFVITATGAGGFDTVAVALARKLDRMNDQPGQHNVVLEITTPDTPYLQCIVADADGVWLEAVSNDFLHDTALSDAQQLLLTGTFGFAPPDVDVSPNFSQHLAKPVDWPQLARLMVTVLTEVYGARDHHELTLTIYPHHQVLP